MNWLFLISFVATIAEITSYVEERVTKYFDSALVKQSTDIWQRHMIAHQNALSVAMQESYGFKGLNMYIRRPVDQFLVSKGYYHTDNQVHIVLQDMRLEEFPHISDPVITFPLTSNVIKLEALVSRMIIHSNYIQFRNSSDIVYDLRDQDAYKTSPFLFEQVKSVGQLAITIEECKLSGIGVISLSGRSVHLGNTVFRLLRCQYNYEIFSPGVGSPPVIANYLPNSEGLNIDHLIMVSLEHELLPKLQAALHTYVNTSAIFREMLPEIRLSQDKVFEQTTNYVNNVIRNLNVLTITRNAGKVEMEDFRINWNDTSDKGGGDSVLTLNNMILTGLETVYTSHTGGPFKLSTIMISEELRFGTLQVRGSIDLQVGNKTVGMYDFAVEINDVDVDVTVNLRKAEDKAPPRSRYVIEVMGWRSLQFSCPGMTFVGGEAIITGYLLTKVPIYLTNYLNSVLSDAVLEADKEYKMLEGGDKLILEGHQQFSESGDGQGDLGDNIANPVANVDGGEGDLVNDDGNIDDGQGNVIEDNLDDDRIESPNGSLDDEDRVGSGGNLDYGDDGTNSRDNLDYEDGATNPSGSKDYVDEVTSPEGSLDYGDAVTHPTGSLDYGDVVTSPEGSLDYGDAVTHPTGNLDYGDAVTSPEGSLDYRDEVNNNHESLIDVDGVGLINPSAVTDEPEIAGPGGGIDYGQGYVAPGDSVVDNYQENIEPEDPGDQLPLQPKFFDENMFADAQNLG